MADTNHLGLITKHSPIPLYAQLRDILNHRIRSGDIRPNQRVPSERKLAEQYGVSRITAKQAIQELEQSGTIYRVSGKGTYVSELNESRVRQARERKLIGVLVKNIAPFFFGQILTGIEDAVRPDDYSVLFGKTEYNLQKTLKYVETFAAKHVAGVVFEPITTATPQDNAEIIGALRSCGIPFVLIDRPLPDEACDVVITDNRDKARQITEHLIQLGHKRIAFVYDRLCYTIEERLAGYLDAHKAASLPVDKSFIYAVGDISPYAEQFPELDDLFIGSSRPTAIFADNVEWAMAVMGQARRLGLAIPGDVAVVSYDDADFCRQLDVPLTTVVQPLIEIGRTAGSILLDRISGKDYPPRQVVLKSRLNIRSSCGTKMAKTKLIAQSI
ncbi:MAG: GntR family transcriptional regulator [Phycisphaerae bacterium]|nr:GntR family transcriptional regulator [Phycisphaerae bacterium]